MNVGLCSYNFFIPLMSLVRVPDPSLVGHGEKTLRKRNNGRKTASSSRLRCMEEPAGELLEWEAIPASMSYTLPQLAIYRASYG